MHHFATAYLGPVSYYAQLFAAEEARIEQWEHYVKQSYRNRCVIATAQGPLPLTIPTESNGGEKCLMRDVRISDHGNWRHLHWRALQSAYGNSPFFEFYEDDFRPFYQPDWEFLTDYNRDLLKLLLRLLDIEPKVRETDSFRAVPSLEFHHPSSRPYYQVFSARHGFIPNLSIVDLLFNMGPESVLYL